MVGMHGAAETDASSDNLGPPETGGTLLRRQCRAATLLCEAGWRWVASAFPVSLHPFQFLLTAGEFLTTGDESIFR